LRSGRLYSINQAGNHEQYYLNFLPPTRYFRALKFDNGVRGRSKLKEMAHKRGVTSKIPDVGSLQWLPKTRRENDNGKRRFADNRREKRGQSTNGKISEICNMLK